jgi:TetR/AcrR family fatty acid metabolism transcriptional regulator
MEEILLRFSSLLDSTRNAEEKLRQFIHLYFQMIEEDQNLAEVFQVELRQSDKFLKDYHNQKFIDFLNLIGDILHQGQSDGQFKTDINIHTMKLIIFGALDELARQWILTKVPPDNLVKTADETSDILIRSILV